MKRFKIQTVMFLVALVVTCSSAYRIVCRASISPTKLLSSYTGDAYQVAQNLENSSDTTKNDSGVSTPIVVIPVYITLPKKKK